jgi:cytidylate kinase
MEVQVTLEERSRMRRQRMTANYAVDHDSAELWDLMFWQSQSPEDRLSALVHIHRDVKKVKEARRTHS